MAILKLTIYSSIIFILNLKWSSIKKCFEFKKITSYLAHNFTVYQNTDYLQLIKREPNIAVAIFSDNTQGRVVLLSWDISSSTTFWYSNFTGMSYFTSGILPSAAYSYYNGTSYSVYIVGLNSGTHYIYRVSTTYLDLANCISIIFWS